MAQLPAHGVPRVEAGYDVDIEASPGNPASGDARLYVDTDLILKWRDSAGTVYEAMPRTDFDDHLNETDPFVHSAQKISYDGAVPSSADIQAAVEWLLANKLDGTAVTDVTDPLDVRMFQLEGLFGNVANTAGIHDGGPGTRIFFEDDFRWNVGSVATSGQIGEKGWLKAGAGVTSQELGTSARPGVIRGTTGTVDETYLPIYAPAASATAPLMFGTTWFDLHMWFRPVSYASCVVRAGLSSDPTSQTPVDGVYVEKLDTDTSFWRNVTRITSSEDRHTSALGPATTNNQYTHLNIYRYSATEVAIRSTETAAGIPGAWSTPLVVTFAQNVALRPFIAIRNTTTTTKQIDIDRVSLLLVDLLR